MKFAVLAAAAFACLTPAAAFAQTAPAQTAPAAKYDLNTPIETLVADPAANAVLTADFGGEVTSNPYYEMFKTKSLNETAQMAPDKLTPELLKKVEADLAAIK